ncbi:MAG: hypothetical protein AAGE84_06525 [Cyanobacteria bacterium P01_G01_bin.39]
MNQPTKLGAIDFISMIYEGHPEYSLIAVKASLDETIQEFINTSQSRKTRQRFDYRSMKTNDVPVASLKIQRKGSSFIRDMDEEDRLANIIPFVKIQGSEWTVILRSIFYASDELWDIPEETKALSEKLDTKVIYLEEEDTSGAIGYELFEKGNSLERFEEACDDDFYFESQLRDKPDIKFNDWDEEDDDEEYDPDAEYDCSQEPRVQFVDAFFQDLGIYLPACYPVEDEGKLGLAVDESSQGIIAEVSFLEIEEQLAEMETRQADPDDYE